MPPAPAGAFRVGIDIGGTFTDIVLLGADGAMLTKKVSSTPDDYSRGIVLGLRALFDEHQIRPAEVVDVVHATTVAANTVLEHRSVRTGLITTEGFRDVLEFRRVRVPELYNLDYVKPPPLVPRQLRVEVRERMGPDGEIRVALDEASVVAAAERLARAEVQAVAVCLLHAYANPLHERRIKELLRDRLPGDVFVSCSHEILPEIREYERTSTTVINAFLGPVVIRYLSALRARLEEMGVARSFHVMQSGGGQMSVASAIAKPAYLIESGPAAGVIAASRLAGQAGFRDVITLDMGGTTAKTAIVEGGIPTKTGEYEIGAGINLSSRLVKGAGYAIKLPFIDVSEIGAGGGSRVWFDKGGLLKVGPQSAASVPGPVCYGKGGDQATLTDALLALGYLNPHYLVGGTLRLQPEAALQAVRRQVCEPLNRPLEEGAFGVLAVAVANMVRAVKSVSTYRGRDPRDYALVAFGGNGPVVAGAIARELAMKEVLIPRHPGVLSAVGLLIADHEQELVKALPRAMETVDLDEVSTAFAALGDTAIATLVAEGFARERIVVRRQADLRYVGQAFELTIPVDAAAPPRRERIVARFHEEHRQTYGHMAESEPVELVNLRIVASVASEASGMRPGRAERPGASVGGGERLAYFGPEFGSLPTPILGRGDLLDREVAGPLIVEEYDATCVVPPGAVARVDADLNLLITQDP
ncbi:MAG TPA: hydantoinase/oxoprolinase family protein [Stellaceae bacterium]|nr:hydantoinase/oxoprolinase family protein [Stellaceae bacterium]